MGGFCSKSLGINFGSEYSDASVRGDGYKTDSSYQSAGQISLIVPQVRECMVKEVQEHKPLKDVFSFREKEAEDDFYDGIPRLTRVSSQKSRSVRSTQAAVAKVTEVSVLLGKAGLGKAKDVLDTLGSSMTDLSSSGFTSGAVTKGNELEILAFEVANTIVKGSNLMQSLSKRNVKQLKEVILPSEGVQNLVSKDMDELLRIVAADKRQELKIFSGEVVRFGNRSKDIQWHNLQRYFDRISKELTTPRQLKEDAELVVEQLMILVQYTAELYQELQLLDRLEQDYLQKRREEDNSAAGSKGDSIAILKAELKAQRKQVKSLKKKSLWSRSFEEVMEKLVDIVHFLLLEIHNTFGSVDDQVIEKGATDYRQRLGPAGLALHYANIIMQIDSLVARSSSITSNAKDTLYQGLPPSVKLALRTKIKSFRVDKELNVAQIKDEMEKTLHWLVPVAANTAKAHHGFGWVGEWANTGTESNTQPGGGPSDILRIETFHHASKDTTEAYILEQVLWLQHLVTKSKMTARSVFRFSHLKSPENMSQQQKSESAGTPSVTVEEQKMLQEASKRKRNPGISKSHDFDSENSRVRKYDPLSKSSGYSRVRRSKSAVIKRFPSGVPLLDFDIDREKALDVIDRVNVPR